MSPVDLASPRLLLTQPTVADVDVITEFCQDPMFEKFLTTPWPYSRADAERFVTEFVPDGWSSGAEATWALRSTDGEFCGMIGLRRVNAEIGFWLGGRHRGRGYMPEAVCAVADWVFGGGFGDLDVIRWECVPGNAASMIVARKCGFTFTGVGPRRIPARDGTHPDAWQGVLRATDSREPKAGWPPVASA